MTMDAGGALQVELLDEHAHIPLAPDEWNRIAAGSETNTVFQTFEWFDAWWRNFGGAHRLFLLVVRAGETVIGLAPFMLRRLAPRLHQLEFVGTGNADYQDVIAAAPDKARVLEAVCARLKQARGLWQRAWLCNIPSHSSTVHHLERIGRTRGLYLVLEALTPCPALVIEGRTQEAKRAIDKYSLRRPMNWFAKRGAVRFRHVTSLAEIEALLPSFFDQHVRRWRAAGHGSLFTDPRQRSFYEALARAGHARGWLLFSIVELDGAPLAFHFGFDHGRRITWYKPAFEVGHAEHSPGLLLIRELINDALARDRIELDFTIGGEAFKGRFANVQRRNLYFGVYHSRLVWLSAIVVREIRRAIGRLLRRQKQSIQRLLARISRHWSVGATES